MSPETAGEFRLPGHVRLRTVDDTHAWGARLGALLKAGDLLLLTGGLGAGKTTLTQGIADGLGVRGPVTSPTYVIARVHPSMTGGPDLVHVDAYRLGGLAELDDLDLDASLDGAVTIVEWGHGVAEHLSEEYLEVTLRGHDTRTVDLVGHGARWTDPAAVAALDGLVSLA
ncbi:MAG: tRNA (adenosine(37)-N6)-threonylcarbamoyltransferase complex ATPase subunit type 1 TsaE [Dermatophilaceae bacterium]